MAIHEFELFHGAVLTRLVRSDHPITLRMIETRPSEAWSSYIINDEVVLVIKHSTNARKLGRTVGGRSWTFQFPADQLSQIRASSLEKQVYVALVGGGAHVKEDPMHVCLLDYDQIQRVLDLQSDRSSSVTVRYLPRKQLRVLRKRKVELLVPQGRLDDWVIPGS